MESDSNGCAWRLATQISKIMDRNEVKREKLTTRRRLVWSCLGLEYEKTSHKHGKFLTVLQLTQIHLIRTLSYAVFSLYASSQLMDP
jgi:hypothetical protein